NTVDWTGTDLHPDTFVIYQNGSQVDTNLWSSGAPISYDIDGLVKGAYNFTIVVLDASSNSANDTVIVTVIDTTDPAIDNPTNVLYAFGTTGNMINWTATDNYPDTYVIYQNGSQVDTGSWSSGVEISYNIDGHIQGDYNYTIIVTDLSGNSIVNTVFVKVVDGTSLSISSPSDIQYSEGSTGNTIGWIGVDDFPENYTIYQNGSQVDTGSWSSGDTISYNIDGLSKGSYNFTIVIFDTSSNSVSDEVIIIVIDTTSPIFDTSPPDLEYAEGETSNQLVWNSTDLYPATYIIYRNGSQIDTNNWDNASTIIINVDGLLKGVYNFTIVVVDLSGNKEFDTVILSVTDETDPSFAIMPNDVIYSEGSEGNFVNWTATDSYEGNYVILQNGSQVDMNSWLSGIAINYTIDGLAKGGYNFTIVVSDSSGNSISDNVFVTVVDLTPPNLSSPLDVQYDEGSTGNKIIWNVNDNYPDIMTVYRNGTIIFSSSWTSGNIEYFIDFLSIGVYNFTIVVADMSSNQASDSVLVTVVDNTNPSVNSPSNVLYSEGTTSNTIDWTGTDLHPNIYIIYQNGSQIDTNLWSSGIQISYNIDNLVKGFYNYTIIIIDNSGKQDIDTVIVTVIDATIPIINTPADVQYYEGDTGNRIPWIITDSYPGNYAVYRNGTEVQNGSWISGVSLEYDIDGHIKGNYNFTIVAFDESYNYIMDSVFVNIIVDSTSPIILSDANNLEMIVGTSNNALVWTASDENAGIYEIYKDGTLILWSTWLSSEVISVNLDGLSIGEYNFTIIIYDTSSNSIKSVSMVSVICIKTNLPSLSYSPNVYEGYTDVITGTWVDDNDNLIPTGIIKVNLNSTELNGVAVVDGTFFLSVDYSLLTAGNYLLSLTFEEASYQNQTVVLQITVLSHQLDVDMSYDNQLIPGEEFTITFRVIYIDPEIQNNLRLNALGTKSGGYEGAEVTTDITLEYEIGTLETLTLIGISDESGFVTFTLNGQQTLDLKSIQSIEVSIAGGLTTEAVEISFRPEDIPNVSTINQNVSSDEDSPLLNPIVLIAIIGALGLFIVFLVMSRKTQEKFDKIQSTKKDILVRLSEMYSIRSILIINKKIGNSLFEYRFKEDRSIDDAVEQLSSVYKLKSSVSNSGSYSSASVTRMIEDLQKYDFLNLYYNKGEKLDIFIFSSGKITQTNKAIQYFDEWLSKKYTLEKNINLEKLFSDKQPEILHGMHIQFDTWTMFKLKTTSK
ncbi:MAG: hypothetical protein ACXAC2_10010, partial [Candidatus Kariarchaeaceae archaeon]